MKEKSQGREEELDHEAGNGGQRDATLAVQSFKVGRWLASRAAKIEGAAFKAGVSERR